MEICFPGVANTPSRPHLLKEAGLCLIEARPSVQGCFLLRYCCGVLLAAVASPSVNPVRVLGGAVACELAVLSAYVFNGIMDIKEDRANGLNRPIARGDLRRGTAAGAVVVSVAGALLISGLLVGMLDAICTAAFVFLGFLYSAPPFVFKSRGCLITVSGFLFGLLTYCGGYSVIGSGRLQPPSLAAMMLLALWTGLIGSGAKDLSDVVGDALAGRRTAPIVFGPDRVRVALAILSGLLATGFVVAAAASPILAPTAAVLMLGAVGVSCATLRPTSLAAGSRDRRPYRAFMLTQYGAHGVLIVSLVAAHIV